ncbi:hypothetical protein SAMN05216559_2716 [Halomicrobium zhouii]|uniref:Dolichyl-phosphate-mannose-protein mannosyltransferase n=1 Tax=Halomicrobium zhouii TaxID=767519 RepID=A0A1I6LHQ7_9EURY|nr:hypothetical protein [Halomicrobium zhouii]SFS02964.1 hypothetical protein SAMN05216559_2716 [Halomicrobium zhouii]
MSVRPAWDDSTSPLRRKTLSLLWGDRVGLLIFLLSLCLFGLTWRTAFLINDSYTIANGVYALEHGSLDMTTAAYGPGLETPGAEWYDGELYSRNYGVIFAALPLVYLLRALELVADLRVVLVAAWCLTLLAATLLAGRILDRRRTATYAGSVAVFGLFSLNVALATPLDPVQHHLIALQIVHMVGAAFVGVFAYRLVRELHDRRRAVLAAVLVTLGTPLPFWAAVPKRHVLTAAVVLAVAFAIARSRDGKRAYATESRALAYVLVGLLAWVHAPEALVVLVALAVVDVPSAPANDARSLAVVGGAFLVSLVPMLATNFALTGDPLTVPRALRNAPPDADLSIDGPSGPNPAADGGDVSLETGGETTEIGSVSEGGAGTPTEGGDGDGRTGWSIPAVLLPVVALTESAVEVLATFGELLSQGLSKLSTRPEQVYHSFVRSGYVDRVARRAQDAPSANLSFLESAPVVAGLVAVIPVALASARERVDASRLRPRVPPVDGFVVVFAVCYSLVYISRLPVHAQVTVRYLFPLYPVAVYGLVRLPPVGAILDRHWRTIAWTYSAGLLVGSQFLLVALVFLAPGRGEAFQFHALLALGTAGPVGAWALTGRSAGKCGQFGALSIGLATAAATTFLIFVTVEYFALGDSHALPMVRVLAELVDLV